MTATRSKPAPSRGNHSRGTHTVTAWSRGQAIGAVAAKTGTSPLGWRASRIADGPNGDHRWEVRRG